MSEAEKIEAVIEKPIEKESESKSASEEIDEDKMTEISMDNKLDKDAKEEIPKKYNSETLSNSPSISSGSGGLVDQKVGDISDKVESIKMWGKNTFLRTRQKVMEKLSRTSRTFDAEIEDKIDQIKVEQAQLRLLLNNNLMHQLDELQESMLSKGNCARLYSDMSKSVLGCGASQFSNGGLAAAVGAPQSISTGVITGGDDHQQQIMYNHQAQLILKSCEISKQLIGRLQQVTAAISTLVNIAYVDCLASCESYESMRLSYDAYKTDVARQTAQLQAQMQSGSTNGEVNRRLDQLQKDLDAHKIKYDSARNGLLEKIQLLRENKSRVLDRELTNERSAWCNYFIDNARLYSSSPAAALSSSSSPPQPPTPMATADTQLPPQEEQEDEEVSHTVSKDDGDDTQQPDDDKTESQTNQ